MCGLSEIGQVMKNTSLKIFYDKTKYKVNYAERQSRELKVYVNDDGDVTIELQVVS